MCLILFAYQVHPEYRLVVAANRDEFYRRPTASAGFWSDCSRVLAGRDLEQQGTWLGVSRQGRFAAVTNVRNGFATRDPEHRSRGDLTRNYLCSDISPEDYLCRLTASHTEYPGYNLLAGDRQSLWYCTNQTDGSGLPVHKKLVPGIYGLSNGYLDSPWPKLQRGKEQLRQALDHPIPDHQRLLTLLSDNFSPEDEALPDTGVSLEWERKLAPCFIRTEDYGTRASTLVLERYDGTLEFIEQNFDAGGPTERREFRIDAS